MLALMQSALEKLEETLPMLRTPHTFKDL